jgi:hypothetical protein
MGASLGAMCPNALVFWLLFSSVDSDLAGRVKWTGSRHSDFWRVHPDHFARLEGLFARLMSEVTPLLSSAETALAQEYLEVREYDLALETIVDDLTVRKAPISQAAYPEIVSLSHLMEGLIDEQLTALRIQ